MPGPKDLDPSISPRALLGAELRHAREKAGLSQDALGQLLFVSGSFIGQLEAGTRRVQPDMAMKLDEILGTNGFFERNCKAANKSKYPDHFAEAAVAERIATAIRQYAQLLIPGLLQTKAYAEAVFRAYQPTAPDAEIDALVEARLERARLLDDPTTPLVVGDPRRGVPPTGGRRRRGDGGGATSRRGPRAQTPHHRAGTAVRRRGTRIDGRPPETHGVRRRAPALLRGSTGHGQAAGRPRHGRPPHADVQPPPSCGAFSTRLPGLDRVSGAGLRAWTTAPVSTT